MSLYTFATGTFTTFADLRRRPTVDRGQILRTLALFIAVAITLALATHRNDGIAVAPSPAWQVSSR